GLVPGTLSGMDAMAHVGRRAMDERDPMGQPGPEMVVLCRRPGRVEAAELFEDPARDQQRAAVDHPREDGIERPGKEVDFGKGAETLEVPIFADQLEIPDHDATLAE